MSTNTHYHRIISEPMSSYTQNHDPSYNIPLPPIPGPIFQRNEAIREKVYAELEALREGKYNILTGIELPYTSII